LITGRNILLVDDETYVTSVVAAKLRKLGDQVRTAMDGEAAFKLATENVPQLVVTDQQMPITNGYELAVKLRGDQRTANVPVLVLTARGHLLTAEQLALTNIRAVLSKPFSVTDLLAKIDEHIARSPAAPRSEVA
jgi:two-component system phosphate regulon response regulator PhoB